MGSQGLPGGNGGFGGQQNPLENAVVLSTIFHYLSAPELRAVRLVSKSWLAVALPIWRKKALITICGKEVVANRWTHEQNWSSAPEDKIGGHIDSYSKYKDSSWRRRGNGDLFDKNRTTIGQFVDYVVEQAESGGGGGGGPSALPFQRFQLDLAGTLREWWGDSDISDFWQLCGPHITYLEVTDYDLTHVEHLRRLILGPKTPNLKTLVLSCDLFISDFNTGREGLEGIGRRFRMMEKPGVTCVKIKFGNMGSWRDQHGNPVHNRMPFTWEEMFSCFPNLEILEIEYRGRTSNPQPYLAAPINLLRQQRQLGKLQNLAHLSLAEPLRNQTDMRILLKNLEESKLNVKTLKLDFANFNGVAPKAGIAGLEFYYKLLELSRDTLETLNVRGMMSTPKGPLPLGVGTTTFPKLETLIINAKQTGRLEWLKCTPKLKSLEVYTLNRYANHRNPSHYMEYGNKPYRDRTRAALYWTNFWSKKKKNKQVPFPICPALKKLVYFKHCSPGEIRYLAKSTPNLESVTIPLDDNSLCVVCQKWKKLRHLTILHHEDCDGGGVTDDGVTGGEAGGKRVTRSSRKKPSVRDLKDLRSVRMIPSDGSKPLLTSTSLVEGFFHLRRLRRFEIVAKLDKKELKSLFDRIPNSVVNRAYNSGGFEKIRKSWMV